MKSIEADYDNLRGVMRKSDYQELDNEVLGQLLRTLNSNERKRISGDLFGRIYEYVLTQFANQKAHHGGELFTCSENDVQDRSALEFQHIHRVYPTMPSTFNSMQPAA